jgi:hypothetical protein
MPITLVVVQVSVREINIAATRHGNNIKKESIDTSIENWGDKSKETCN